MKPRVKLAESTTADGGAMTLYEHDGKYCISYSGQELMHSGANASEILLGELVELLPEIVSWNREYLKSLNGALLEDPRVEIHTTDVVAYVRKAERARYDVILMDVDNGPVAMVSETNTSLYSNSGLRWMRSSLKPTGRAVFWSAGPDLRFEDRLKRAGFRVTKVPAKVHAGSKRAAYLLYVANYK